MVRPASHGSRVRSRLPVCGLVVGLLRREFREVEPDFRNAGIRPVYGGHIGDGSNQAKRALQKSSKADLVFLNKSRSRFLPFRLSVPTVPFKGLSDLRRILLSDWQSKTR